MVKLLLRATNLCYPLHLQGATKEFVAFVNNILTFLKVDYMAVKAPAPQPEPKHYRMLVDEDNPAKGIMVGFAIMVPFYTILIAIIALLRRN
jgi:hypothetical protein